MSSEDESEFEAASDNASSSDQDVSEEDEEEGLKIRSELSAMSFEELMKLKEHLGAKVYNEAVFGEPSSKRKKVKKEFKRENKNRPREMSSKKPVPFIGTVKKTKKAVEENRPLDPRFDEKCGDFDGVTFKKNFAFVSEIRENDLSALKEQLKQATDDEERKKIKFLMQRIYNQNLEEKRNKQKEEVIEEERHKIRIAQQEGKIPHYSTKRELKARELVKQYVELKKSGKLNKHLEKRRKKNAGRDRKKFSFD